MCESAVTIGEHFHILAIDPVFNRGLGKAMEISWSGPSGGNSFVCCGFFGRRSSKMTPKRNACTSVITSRAMKSQKKLRQNV